MGNNTLVCPNCQSRFKNIPENIHGRKIRCKKCNHRFIANIEKHSSDKTLSAVCPGCGKEYKKISIDLLGKRVKCPSCQSKFRVLDSDALSLTSKQPGMSTKEPEKAGVVDTRERWEIGNTVENLYRVDGLLGRGGMGSVHKVHHLGWNIDLAVKSPLAAIMEKKNGPENFEREAETWINLPLHPHIVSCYYVRRILGMPRVIAEFVDGGSLGDWIKNETLYREGPAESLKLILSIAIQFAWGLDFSHEQGLIHQDVKPANVMLTKEGLVKVTDFGLARANPMNMDPNGDQAGTIMVDRVGMTPAYASPEQASGKTLTRRTDLWSWAVSVLEMFIGEVSWPSGVAAGLALETYLNSEPNNDDKDEPPDRPRMPERLAELLRECFREKPDERPHNLNEVAERLISIYQETISEPYPQTRPKAGRDNAAYLNNRALSLLDLGRTEEALAHFNQALAVEPHHPEATYNLGLVKWRAGEITDLDLLNAMKEVRQSHEETWVDEYYLALVHMERGDFDSAVEVLETLEGEDALRPEIKEKLTQCREKAARLKPETIELRMERTDPYDKSKTFSQIEGAFISDNRQSLILNYDIISSRLLIFSLPEGELKLKLKDRGRDSYFLTQDGRWALAGSKSGPAALWDVETSALLTTLEGYKGAPSSQFYRMDGAKSLYITSDKKRLYNGASNRLIQEWDITEGELLGCFATSESAEDDSYVIALDVDEKNGIIVSCDDAGSLRVWDLKTRSCLKSFENIIQKCKTLKIADSGKSVIIGDAESNLKILDLKDGSLILSKNTQNKRLNCCEVSPCNKYLITCGFSGGLKLWEVDQGRCLRTFERKNEYLDGYLFCCWSDNKRPFAFMAKDKSKYVYKWYFDNSVAPFVLCRAAGGEETARHTVVYEKYIQNIKKALLLLKYDSALKNVELAREIPGYSRGRETLELLSILNRRLPVRTLRGGWEVDRVRGADARFTALSLSPDGDRILTGSIDRKKACELKLWDAATMNEIRVYESFKENINHISFTPDGEKALITGNNDNYHTGLLIDLESGIIESSFKYCGVVYPPAISPDADFFYSTSYFHEALVLYDANTGRCINVYNIKSDDASNFRMTPDGRRLAFHVDSLGVTLICNISTLHLTAVRTLLRGPKHYTIESFRPDGKAVLSGFDGRVNSILVWGLEKESARRPNYIGFFS